MGRVELFAPATVLVTRPRAADSQASANENAVTMPTTASQSRTEAFGRKPFIVAPVGLIVSWLFAPALNLSGAFPGTTGRGVLALMSLHVSTAVITVLLLRAQGLPKA